MTKQWIKDSIWYVIGSVLYALSVSVFSTPNDIAPGGAAGIAIILHALIRVPVGLVVILINIPLLIAAFFKLSRRFALRSAFVIVLSSAVIDITEPLVPPFREDKLLATLCAGLLAGVGVGLIMLRMASTGGSEIAARLLQRKRPHLSVGRLILVVDAIVVALSAIVFGELSAALYAAVQVFVCSVTIDQVVYGREEGRLLMVVTSKPKQLCDEVTERLSRGVTVLKAVGGYTGSESALLLCAVSRPEVPSLKRLILKTDASAFVMVITTQQVIGEGFLVPDDF